MLSGPELARLQRQLEEDYLTGADPEHSWTFQNHEQDVVTEDISKQDNSLFKTFSRMGNPFLDDFPELVTLDSRNCMDESVTMALCTVEVLGIKQYRDCVKEVLEDGSVSIHESIKKNFLALFKRPQPKTTSKQGEKIRVLQNNEALFGQ